MFGLLTRIWEIGVNYSYRDVERNAVVGAFTDSDFAAASPHPKAASCSCPTTSPRTSSS
jgi:hypothetical protein